MSRTVPQEIASGAAGRILRGIQKAKPDAEPTFPLSGVEAGVVIDVLQDYRNKEYEAMPTEVLKKALKKLRATFDLRVGYSMMNDKNVTLSTLEAMTVCVVLELFANNGRSPHEHAD